MDFLLPLELLFAQLPIFLLVMFRLAGIFAIAPMLSSMAVPFQIKLFIVLLLSCVVFPSVLLMGTGLIEIPQTMMGLIIGVSFELMIGIVLGFTVVLLFVGVQLGGELISQQMSLSMAQSFDPMTNATSDVVSRFYGMLMTLIFILLDGHLVLIKAVIDTFSSLPLMSMRFNEGMLDYMVGDVLANAFAMGLQIAAPAVVAIFLATLALGFISRTMPQLNILAAGFPLRIMLALILLLAGLASVCAIFQEELRNVLQGLSDIFMLS